MLDAQFARYESPHRVIFFRAGVASLRQLVLGLRKLGCSPPITESAKTPLTLRMAGPHRRAQSPSGPDQGSQNAFALEWYGADRGRSGVVADGQSHQQSDEKL